MAASGHKPDEQTAVPAKEAASGCTATITLGVDGRIYFHDVPPEILSIAAEICPGAPAVSERLKLACLYVRKNDEHSTEQARRQEPVAVRPG
jgi:hypothetical protein